jgi:hypothetical protein
MNKLIQRINAIKYSFYQKFVDESLQIIKPFYSDGYYMQTFEAPKKYFVKLMQSGKYGLCKVTKVEEYTDFGNKMCYSINFKWTGLWCEGIVH